MAKFDIHVNSDNCTGCLRCQLSCSDLYFKIFQPSLARIRVEVTGLEATISFNEDCTSCGTCADQCFYGALTKVKREDDK